MCGDFSGCFCVRLLGRGYHLDGFLCVSGLGFPRVGSCVRGVVWLWIPLDRVLVWFLSVCVTLGESCTILGSRKVGKSLHPSSPLKLRHLRSCQCVL